MLTNPLKPDCVSSLLGDTIAWVLRLRIGYSFYFP